MKEKKFSTKMLSEANVFVTSFRPGALKRLGLDYETMRQTPHIVWASINGFGDYGPDKDNAGFDTVAFSGALRAMLDLVEEGTSPINLYSCLRRFRHGLSLRRYRCRPVQTTENR